MRIKIKRCGAIETPLPKYQTSGAVAFDLHAAIDCVWKLPRGSVLAVPTGWALEIPEGYEGTVRARSGTARDFGIICANGIGTIDQDFRGELSVLLGNIGMFQFEVKPMDRIAQMVISPVVRVEFEVSDTLSETARDAKGFGSTTT